MDSVRQRRREEAAATRERISEIKKKMQVWKIVLLLCTAHCKKITTSHFQASETWQSRVNRVLAILYPLLLVLALSLGAYCVYQYTTIYMNSRTGTQQEEVGVEGIEEDDILEAMDDGSIEEILAEDEWGRINIAVILENFVFTVFVKEQMFIVNIPGGIVLWNYSFITL